MPPSSLQIFADCLPREGAPQEVLGWLQSPDFQPQRILVACSGGADSVALACWMRVHFPDLSLQLAHVHHGIRGEDADHDAESVRSLAGRLGVDCAMRFAQAKSGASEDQLRLLRMELLAEMAAAFDARAIVFGHHADDVLENLLFRIARGSSLSGLAGMRAIQSFSDRPTHLRPFLHFTSRQIVHSLQTAGLSWREDLSNASDRYDRNRIRHELLPVIEEIFPQRDLRLAASGVHRQLGEVDALLESMSENWFQQYQEPDGSIPRQALRAEPRALQRRILERWARRYLPTPLSRNVLEDILDQLASRACVEWVVAKNTILVLENQFLRLKSLDSTQSLWDLCAPLSITPPGEWNWDGDGLIQAEWVEKGDPGLSNALERKADPFKEAYLCCPDEEIPILVRNWQPGDRFQPLGAPGLRKLQDWFIDRNIPQPIRHRLPVFCSPMGDILWIPGFAPADACKLSFQTVRALRLTYRTPSAP